MVKIIVLGVLPAASFAIGCIVASKAARRSSPGPIIRRPEPPFPPPRTFRVGVRYVECGTWDPTRALAIRRSQQEVSGVVANVPSVP